MENCLMPALTPAERQRRARERRKQADLVEIRTWVRTPEQRQRLLDIARGMREASD